MEEKIDKAIESLVSTGFKAGQAPKCDDALKYSQAILNLCHAKVYFSEGKKPAK